MTSLFNENNPFPTNDQIKIWNRMHYRHQPSASDISRFQQINIALNSVGVKSTSTSTADLITSVLLEIKNHPSKTEEIDQQASALQLRLNQIVASGGNTNTQTIAEATSYASKQMHNARPVKNGTANKIFATILSRFEAVIPPQD